MSFVRQYVVQLLTLRSQAEQIADEYGVEAGSTYQNDVAQRQGTAATLPEEVRDDYVELTSAPAYAQDVVDQVGAIVLDDQGVADPTTEQVTQAGIDVFNQWPDANGIEIDPRYGLASVDGVLTPVDTNTSVAVGETAKPGLAERAGPGLRRDAPARPTAAAERATRCRPTTRRWRPSPTRCACCGASARGSASRPTPR